MIFENRVGKLTIEFANEWQTIVALTVNPLIAIDETEMRGGGPVGHRPGPARLWPDLPAGQGRGLRHGAPGRRPGGPFGPSRNRKGGLLRP